MEVELTVAKLGNTSMSHSLRFDVPTIAPFGRPITVEKRVTDKETSRNSNLLIQ